MTRPRSTNNRYAGRLYVSPRVAVVVRYASRGDLALDRVLGSADRTQAGWYWRRDRANARHFGPFTSSQAAYRDACGALCV